MNTRELSYTLIGHIGSKGEAVYWSKEHGLAVEKDHTYLATPTAEEMVEMHMIFPHLKGVSL